MTIVKDSGLKTFDNTSDVYAVMTDAFSYAQQMLLGFNFNFN